MKPVRTTQLTVAEDIIDLGIGQPSPGLLPLTAMRAAAEDRLASDPALLAYGFEQGDGYLRRHLARFLSDGYGLPVAAEHLFVTAGASQALDLICTLFARPGDTVLVEEPTYFLALRIFADHDLKVVGLPMDGDGLLIDALEAGLRAHPPAFLYTVPTFHNPAGCVLAAERRQRLADISRENRLLVVADEVYHLLSYTAAPPPPMAAHAPTAPILSLGSFSKILAPGLRLGWIQAGEDLLERFVGCGLLDSGGGLNPFASGIVQRAIERGLLRENLTQLKTTYGARLRTLCAALDRYLTAEARFAAPDGGFFVWLTLPGGMDADAMLSTAKKVGVGYLPGSRCSSREGLKNRMRLSFSYYDDERLETGARRLAQVIGRA